MSATLSLSAHSTHPARLALRFLLPLALVLPSCTGTTGYQLVTFYAAASGPADSVKGRPYAFTLNDSGTAGTKVTLTEASLHVGALYLTQAVPTSGGGPAACTLPGTYDGVFVGEVRGGGDINLLDPAPQELLVTGDGSTIPAETGQVWLMHGDVNEESDPLPVLTLRGSFELPGVTHTFSAAITIDQNRLSTTTATSGLPGQDPICQLRIVPGIPVALTLAQSGTLVLKIDPKALFTNAKLSDLPPCPGGMPTDVCFTNDSSNQPSINLFGNLTASSPYQFEWRGAQP